MQVFLAIDGQRRGPFPSADIRLQLQRGDLPRDVPAWHAGLVAWTPIGRLPAFAPTAFDGENPPPVPATGPHGTDVIIRIPKALAAEEPAEPPCELPPLNRPTSSRVPVESAATTATAEPAAAARSPKSRATMPAPPARAAGPGLSLSGAVPRGVDFDMAGPISASDLFGTAPLTSFVPPVATGRQWPARLAIALVFGVAGWSAGQWLRSPALDGWIRPSAVVVTPTTDSTPRPAGQPVAVPPLEPRPPEAQLEFVLSEARRSIGEADWTLSARRHLSDAQALRPGDPRILDLSFALEAKLLGGRSPTAATTTRP